MEYVNKENKKKNCSLLPVETTCIKNMFFYYINVNISGDC